ncbi:MAG: hypothetical protein KKB31_01175 [Nanoarchaeota archaeon]|nr:hypothetical protein [Nanoarchaeota archaeon]
MTTNMMRYEFYQVGEQGAVGFNQHVLLLKEGKRDVVFAHCPPERRYGFLSPEQTEGVREIMSGVKPITIVGGEEAGLAEAILSLPVSPSGSAQLTSLTQSLLNATRK